MLHIQRSGSLLDFSKRDIGNVSLDDLLESLSNENRYSGNIDWSVLEHSVIMGRLAEDIGMSEKVVRFCYLHDLHEAIVRDVPTPIKRMVGEAWYVVEKKIQTKLLKAIGHGDLTGLDTHGTFQTLDRACAYYEAMLMFPLRANKFIGIFGNDDNFAYLFPLWKKRYRELKALQGDGYKDYLKNALKEVALKAPVA